MTQALPISPIGKSIPGPAPQVGIVQINLGTLIGQIVTGAEFGLGTTMGDLNFDYLGYADPAFQTVANQHPVDLLRHNWLLNKMMNAIFPTRASASAPDFSSIDNYLNQQNNLLGFFNNSTATQIITLGFPSWLNISNPSDQALYASMVKEVAQHFFSKSEPIHSYELVNEPESHYSVVDLSDTFNAVAQALKSVDPTYKLGGLTESWMIPADLRTFFQMAGPNVGFVSWHQYVTSGSDGKTSQQEVTNSMDEVQSSAQQVRTLMRAAAIPDSVPLFLGEYNIDYGNYFDPNNGNMVGAVAAAATTYGMIHSNSNMTMGALWSTLNDGTYNVFGSQWASYHVDSVGVVLSDLGAYMPGNLVQTIMPSNTPGLVGYTTDDGHGFSAALIDTNLSQGYSVDLSKDGLPTTGLYRIEVSNAYPLGAKTGITDLSQISVAAGSVVIISDEAPHGGTEFTGMGITTLPSPITTGSGSDTLVLNLSEDAYKGDAQFTVWVDGKQLAGTFTATASHAAGASQTFTFKGDWAPGAHAVAVNFLNDAYAGTAATDRNLYVNSIRYDGTNTSQSAALMAAGAKSLSVTDTTAIPAAVTGSGADMLVLNISEDAYLGDAQYTVSLDGTQLGGTFTAIALHSANASQNFVFNGDFSSGQHALTVNFLNDAWAGTPATDRNLYVNAVTYCGTNTNQSAALMAAGAKTFVVAGGTTPAVSETGDHGSLQKTLTQTGTYKVGGDTFVLSGGNAAAVTLGTGASQIKFLGTGLVTLTAGAGQAVVTADAGTNRFTAGTGSLDVTGGGGKDGYTFHANSGLLTLEDFSLAKGDTLTVDKAMQGSFNQASDGQGGTMLSFGTAGHGVDIHGLAVLPSTNVLWA